MCLLGPLLTGKMNSGQPTRYVSSGCPYAFERKDFKQHFMFGYIFHFSYPYFSEKVSKFEGLKDDSSSRFRLKMQSWNSHGRDEAVLDELPLLWTEP